MEEQTQTPSAAAPMAAQNLSVPIAIVIAGALIAAALYFVGGGTGTTNTNDPTPTAVEVKAVSSDDHILGNPDAEIMIIEYSDLDCPFCKQFHATMKQIISEYGADGKVAWVYRNFPLEQLHPNAPKLAEASECVAELGGNDAYWKFLDAMFEAAPAGTMTDMTMLPALAAKVGVSTASFNTCFASGKHKAKIAAEFNDAVASGGQGTPHNVVLNVKTGKTVPIPGAQPYATIKSVIDSVLAGN